MKTKILALSVSFLLVSIGIVNASVSVDESTSAPDLKRHGYSDKIIESIRLTKCQGKGQDCLSDDQIKYQNAPKYVNWTRKFFIYLDPALDADVPMMHNIKTTPSVNDL